MALTPGLYDAAVTEALRALLDARPADLLLEEGELDPSSAPWILARLLHDRVVRALDALPSSDKAARLDQQIALTNRLLELLVKDAPESGALASDRVARPPKRLLSVVSSAGTRLGEARPPPRPLIPLGATDLLVNGKRDVSLGPAVRLEIASSDRVDLLCSFLKWSGFRLLEDVLREFLDQGKRLRVLTTAYMGATERRALDELSRLGAEVKVSYDSTRTRLHAKAWLFHRDSGFSTACIGSSNLSAAAMLDGVEWNVRLSQIDNDPILRKFQTTFDQYWEDPEFKRYDPATSGPEFDAAVSRQRTEAHRLIAAITVEPRPHQREILEALAAEREHGHWKNLVVAATGTGKTIVAALDYKRLRKELNGKASLLFVAHRHEILEQSLTTFRVILQEAGFGERLGNGEAPRAGEHVFASVQSLHEERLSALPRDAYDVVIVDEFHHAAARTYGALLAHLQPKFLLGLTATPERADGKSILGWFDGRIAAELRLWKALDQGLLVPFQYFGVGDGKSLKGLKWLASGYDRAQLSNLYTADHLWAKLVLGEVHRKIADVSKMKALGFCVDVDHAEFMAERFNEAGLASVAVSERTSRNARAEALARLRSGELRALFSVDLFNEGVDLPDVDTVLFLRPTESATVFLQQLGRGLRRAEGKECLTVLDFIGDANRRFRFDQRFRAIVGGTRRQIATEVAHGFPSLPSGCAIHLDRDAQQAVLDNIQAALGLGYKALAEDLVALGRDVGLKEFLLETGAELEDVYAAATEGKGWTALRRRAGLPTPAAGALEPQLEKALARMLHVDDPLRLTGFQRLFAGDNPAKADASSAQQRMLLMLLGFRERPLAELQGAWDDLWRNPAILDELRQLLERLDDRVRRRTWPLERLALDVPLRVHGTYTLDEVMAAFDERDAAGRVKRLREGVFHAKRAKADLLFVTLEKAESDYSPSTMYNDYAISPRRFHWESQSAVHEGTETGKRYIEHERRGQRVLLFVRQRLDDPRPGVKSPYLFLGPAAYQRHKGARPMAIEWLLEREIPAAFFQEIKVAEG